jgi:hypothetical protein
VGDARDTRAPDDRGGHGHGQLRPALIGAGLAIAVVAVLLCVYLRQLLERRRRKSRLEVLDGAAAGGDIDLAEAAGGDRR